ncbi:MAG: neuraminidase-like domain-containing protein [Pseudomonadota bacterium]
MQKADGGTEPDLVFQVYDSVGTQLDLMSIFILNGEKETVVERLSESKQAPFVLTNAGSKLELRLVIDLHQRPLTEYEQLVAKLNPFMHQVSFIDLKEDEENFQISFLSKESGVKKIKIEQLRDSFKQERESIDIPAWAFFGLTTTNTLLESVDLMTQEELISVLTPLQPNYDKRELAAIADKLLQFVKEQNIRVKIADLKASLGDLLQPLLTTETMLNTFLEVYARHDGDLESFWKDMSDDSRFQSVIPQIQLNLQLSQLTLGNKGLIASLIQAGTKNTRQLVDLSTEQWDALAFENKAEIPLHIIGKDDVERSKIYSRELQTLIEISFPTDVIKKGIQNPEVNVFLANNPKFDFTLTPVEAYLQDQEEQVLQNIEDPESVKTHLRKIQRLYTLTANAADMNVLMDLGYESAHQIAMLSVEDFHQSMGEKISEDNARAYHAKALVVSDASVMVYQQLRDLVGTQSLNAAENLRVNFNTPIGVPNDLGEILNIFPDTPGWEIPNNLIPRTNVLPGIPDWESLFGATGMCACQHCKSVYSPAAYFVDLLHILLGKNKGAARIEIFRRRPDLMYTKLSCQHTETLIPYIDLVNEVLETYVAQDFIGDKAANNHANGSTNDTSNFSESDLAANPQHPNAASLNDAATAYDKLKGAIYPMGLPFDMDVEVARRFLQKQESSRFEVLDTFKVASANAVASERLGITSREFEILTFKQFDGVTNAFIIDAHGLPRDFMARDLWGIPIGRPFQKMLANVRNFLDYTNITYVDLVSLLNTRFLNPNFPINIFLQQLSKIDRDSWLLDHPAEDQLALTVIELGATNPEARCDLNQTQIQHLNGDTLNDEELSRFNRFIRLWKKLGCSISELDSLLMSINPAGSAEITPQIIHDLSVVWEVRRELDLPLDQAAVLMGNIPTYGKGSLFARLFLNKAILQIDDKFVLKVDQSEIDHSTEFLKPHVPAIQAALQISEEDFNHLINYINLDITVDTLTVENLSKIYRYVIFAKGLRLKVKDLITWFDLLPQAPWKTVTELANSTEALKKLNRYGFKADDFAYIFSNVMLVGNMLPPKDDVIRQSSKTLFEGLQKISQENTPSDGIVTNDFLRRVLGNILEVEEATKIIGVLDGTNTVHAFDSLASPKISENYQDILKHYLTPPDVALLAATADIPQRLKIFWEKIAARILPVLKRTFVQQHVAAAFKTELGLVTYFLKDAAVLKACLDVEAKTTNSEKAYFDSYVLLYKCLWLVDYLRLSEKELSHFQGNANFNNFDWKALNFATWLRIADFVALRDSLPTSEKDLLSIFEVAKAGEAISSAIIDVTGWDKQNVEFFVSQLPATDFLNEIALIILKKRIDLSQVIGVSIEKLESWANDSVTHDQAQDIKRSLKTKYDERSWIDVSTQVHNLIRNDLRDALVAYLLQKSEIKAAGLKNANDLYGYFLIDMEMDAGMLTSRLKQAIASVQLFVQRCLLNLESHKTISKQIISPDMIDANQWKWMKNYRVWEANRKVFLYPENWIEPELRDNKSPFFKELESELLQGEVTNESAEKALMNYLEKLHTVGRLDICGTCEDYDARELHVFGRTFNFPPQYFYRKLDLETQVWTAWEKVQLDIQGHEEGDSAGVHLMPVVWNRRLYLFWPIFTEKVDEEEKERQRMNGYAEITFSYYEVKLAWSEYRSNKWSNKKISQSFIETLREVNVAAPTHSYRFKCILGDSLTIEIYALARNALMGEFRFDCGTKISAYHHIDFKIDWAMKPVQTTFYQGFLSASSGQSILWHEKESFPLILRDGNNNIPTLSASVQEYKVVFPSDHDFSYNSSARFFYQDHKRSYYVEPQFEIRTNTTIAENTPITLPTKKLGDLPIYTPKIDTTATQAINRFYDLNDIDVKKLQFKPFFHAYVCKFIEVLDKNGVEGLLNIHNQRFSDLQIKFATGSNPPVTNNFYKVYSPNKTNVDPSYPMENIDFSATGAYSLYNWELFFHIPMLLANRLSKNQRFDEATRWYHFIFNPTTNDKLSSSSRYWQVIPLRNSSKQTLDALLDQLALPANNPKRRELENAITAWRKSPFNPHLIARMRLSAYQKNTVMKYLDNLVDWADTLFRQDTIESINEATQLYILAAELIGRRQEKIPERGTMQALNYAELDKGLDAFSNALVKFETIFPFYNLQVVPSGVPGTGSILNSTAKSLYFCVPDNDKLLGYWDRVADRLFKIRHSQNIEGVERQLALFEPTIEPALLVRAVAGGVDISSVLADLNSPLPYYRFNYIVMKALEICSELKSLGNSLLSALEKKDNETLSMMRTQHETLLLTLVKTLRKLQITEAQRVREGLEKTRAVTEMHANFYTQLIKTGLNSSEMEHQLLGFSSMALSVSGQYLEMAASTAHAVPDQLVGGMAGPGGGGITLTHVGGGEKTANTLSAFGRFFNMLSTMTSFAANSAQVNAGYQRRSEEWKLQKDLANKELAQIDKQILASQIREQIAEQELSNHEQQIENANQVEEFYRNKFTQEELYGWMVGEISTTYFQCYQLAYDLAKKAEKTYRYELGLPTSNFVQFGVWDSFRKGLMSGERLYLCLKQMEKSYMDQNRREFEIIKNISLVLHDPMALITLKETGTCVVGLPETLFDVDFPGQYMRRIKSVSVTIPCVAGPHTGVNCTLTLLSSETRMKSTPQNPYAQQPDDNRFVQNFAATQSIATSTGQNDSGLFELNFRDERYLPFEGHGVISTWRIELPSDFRQFDYETMSDVVLHLKYTSREGGKQLREMAEENLKSFLKIKDSKGQHPESRAFSLRHEYPTEWHKLLTTTDDAGDHIQSFVIDKQRFPFIYKNGNISVHKVKVFGYPKSNNIKPKLLNKLLLIRPNGGEIIFKENADFTEISSIVSEPDFAVEIKNPGMSKNDVEWLIKIKKENVGTCLETVDDILLLFEYTVKI